jgi:VanZ family protein
MPNFGGYDLSLKKGGHMLGYAFLAAAYTRAIGRQRRGAMALAWSLAILYAASDEFHQSFVPGRSARILDIGIDGLGALLGLLPFILKFRRVNVVT